MSLVVLATALVVSAAEYLAWAAVGELNEPIPIAVTTLAIAAVAAAIGAVVARFSRLGGLFTGLAIAWAPFASVGVVHAITAAVVFVAAAGLFLRTQWKVVVGITALSCLAGAAHAGISQVRPERRTAIEAPDVVLLVMDTTRRDRLSVYGYPKPTTPHLERFAEKARVYEDAWSVAPWTSPSHASMFTGLLPAEHGVDGALGIPFPQGVQTLPELLSKAGYRTAGFPGNPNLYAPGWNRGFDVYLPAEYQKGHSLIRVLNRLSRRWRDPAAHAMSDRLLARARHWWRDNEGAPRFLFINLIDPHGPHIPTEHHYEAFLPDIPFEKALAVHARRRPDGSALPPWKPRETDILSRLYDAEIADMDERIGDFIGWLDVRGDLDDTLIVITSDHGERLGERGLVGHSLVMDPYLLRVPLIVRYPPELEPARVRKRVQLDGLAESILQTIGLESPAVMSGLGESDSAVAQLRPPVSIVDDMVEADPSFDAKKFRRDWFYVTRGRFALEWSVGGAATLTDVVSDPEFTRDVSNDYPEEVEALAEVAKKLPRYEAVETRDVDPELMQKLKALGYVR